ncbi:hypothetical protein GE061_008227 [Apolygus lucorum]|uniref:Uncharacterized protein n=1 Tax=Apolygus lucorum TaxID=248454 RepID=A0A8S9WQM2_APOLU|nr:hypothetical protein GE061_008227 [Apolygus lucorum]
MEDNRSRAIKAIHYSQVITDVSQYWNVLNFSRTLLYYFVKYTGLASSWCSPFQQSHLRMMVFLPFTVCCILSLGTAYFHDLSFRHPVDNSGYHHGIDHVVYNYPGVNPAHGYSYLPRAHPIRTVKEVDHTVLWIKNLNHPNDGTHHDDDMIIKVDHDDDRIPKVDHDDDRIPKVDRDDDRIPKVDHDVNWNQEEDEIDPEVLIAPFLGVDLDVPGFVDAASRVAAVQGDAVRFIGKVETVLLNDTLFRLTNSTHTPVRVAKLVWNLIDDNLNEVMEAKDMLGTFWDGYFENQAKALYGTLGTLSDFYFKARGWARNCIEKFGVDCQSLPAIGDFGPCGGVWPCTKTSVCKTYDCLSKARLICLETFGTECYELIGKEEVPKECPKVENIQDGDPCRSCYKAIVNDDRNINTSQTEMETTTELRIESTTEKSTSPSMSRITQPVTDSATEQNIKGHRKSRTTEPLMVSTTEPQVNKHSGHGSKDKTKEYIDPDTNGNINDEGEEEDDDDDEEEDDEDYEDDDDEDDDEEEEEEEERVSTTTKKEVTSSSTPISKDDDEDEEEKVNTTTKKEVTISSTPISKDDDDDVEEVSTTTKKEVTIPSTPISKKTPKRIEFVDTELHFR